MENALHARKRGTMLIRASAPGGPCRLMEGAGAMRQITARIRPSASSSLSIEAA